MRQNPMNNQLTKIYETEFEKLSSKLMEYNENVGDTQKATNPFLLKVPENYTDFSNKIMIFGQETNSWCGECGDKSAFSNKIEKSIQIYQQFYLDGGINRYRGAFWNEFKRIKKQVSESNNAVIIWNNINKIGRIGKGNVHSINEIQFEYFNVIRDEIRLLKPNIIIFLTGHHYDFFIKHNLGKFKQKEIKENLYELNFVDEFENIKCFKTFHPGTLYRNKINRIVIHELIDNVKNACI